MSFISDGLERKSVNFHDKRCIMAGVRNGSCRKCQDACPRGILTLKEGVIDILQDTCSNCGVCTSVCPTGALTLHEDIFSGIMKESSGSSLRIRCKEIDAACQVECIGEINALQFAALGMIFDAVEIEVTTPSCKHCKGDIHRNVTTMVSRANEFLGKIGRPSILLTQLKGFQKRKTFSRRDLFGICKALAVQTAERMVSTSGAAVIDPRATIFERLQQVGNIDETMSASPLFYGIRITDKCDLCGLCTKICKYNALTVGMSHETALLNHAQSKCVGCESCKAVCPRDAIEISSAFSRFSEVKNGSFVSVAARQTEVCTGCGCAFVAKNRERECDICRYHSFNGSRSSIY